MPSPGLTINLFDLTVYSPQLTTAIVGCVGPATKGPVNRITEFTDQGNFLTTHGRPPAANYYSQRGFIRYLNRGDKGKYVRVAGRNLKAATLVLYAADGRTPILNLTAGPTGSGAGTWANGGALQVAVTYNGDLSYNIFVYQSGQLVEQHLAQTNGIVVTRINNFSSRMTAVLAPGAAATFPAATVDTVTGALNRLSFAGGDDGALATTNSLISSTSGVAGKRFFGKMDSVGGSRVWQNILTIAGALAGKTSIRGSVGMAVVPGTFTVRVQTGAGPTFVELSDSGNLTYPLGAGGVGLLAPSAGTHKGFIDYRTGTWGVLLGAGTTFATGTVDGIWVRGNSESVGATAAGTGMYAGTLSTTPVALGHFNANKAVITVPIDEQVGAIVAALSHGSATAGLKTLSGWIVPGSVVLTVTHPTDPVPAPVYDDGFGGWRTGPNGTGVPLTGTLNYRTGVFSVTWDPTGPAVPATGSVLGAEYATLVLNMGGGGVAGPTGVYVASEIDQPNAPGGATAASTDLNAQPLQGIPKRGTIRITISDTSLGPDPFVAYSDGTDAGGVEGWLSRPRGDPTAVVYAGSVNRVTGAWTITLPGGGTVTAAATIAFAYVSAYEDAARRELRGPGPQTQGAGGTFGTGLVLGDQATANDFNGINFLDHRTGRFAFQLDIQPLGVGTQSFNVQDNGTLTAVYAPASILGFGDGSAVTFAGLLAPAPFRRQANRLLGFQASQGSLAGAGDPQVTFATLGPNPTNPGDPTADYWAQNVALSTDPANKLDFRSGVASIKWTGAPELEEAVYVIGEEVVLHATCKYPGDIGNERAVLTSGFYVEVGSDPTLAGTIKLEVFFNTALQESFGQAVSVDELVAKVNDPTNGSQLVSVAQTPAATFLAVDTGAVQRCGLGGAFTIADVIGAKVGQTYTGLQLFRNDETVAVNWLMIPGQWHRQVILALQQLCERPGRRAIGIIPSPDLNDPFLHRDFFNGSFNSASPGGVAVPTVLVPYPPTVAIDSNQLATCVPWVNYFDQANNQDVWEPPDGEMANLVANAPQPWYPIAGYRRGKVNVSLLRYSAPKEDRDLIYGPVGSVTEIVNPIIVKFGRGPALFGQRTAQRAATALDRINVRWTVNVLMNQLDLISQDFLFEINDSFLWREATQALNKVLKPIIEQRGLTDAFVICDATTNTPDVIDQLKMRAKLFIKPARATEFIEYDLILTPTGADFAEVTIPG
jgi:hypothetical protein